MTFSLRGSFCSTSRSASAAPPAGETDIRLRGDRTSASPVLIDRFRNGHLDWPGAEVHFGLMLSGEKLIDQPDFLRQLLALEPEAIGGEMEGAGLYAAAQQQHTDWILVKAISDWANGDKQLNQQEHQTLAARNAAGLTFHVLAQGGLADLRSRDARQPTTEPARYRETQMRRILTERFNLEELQTMCFDLGIDFDDLGAVGKTANVRALLQHFMNRRQMHRLDDWLRIHRPDIDLTELTP